MTRATLFEDAFWEQDITSTRGFDILVRRLKEGRKICKEVEDYFKERAKAEQTYAKAITNISRRLDCKEELGILVQALHELKVETEQNAKARDETDLGQALRKLKTETEQIAKAHDEAYQDFSKLQKELAHFSENQKQQKQEKEERVRQLQNEKISKYKTATSQKDKYAQKCKDMESASDTYAQAKQNVTTTTKDLMKIEKNKDKANDQMKNADILYKSAVATLETARKSWEREMELFCKICQHLEEERIDFLRDRLWKCTNVDSQTCVEHDEVVDKVRSVLEKCDISQDVQQFIEKNRLGRSRPGTVAYEAYHRRQSTDPTVYQGSGPRTAVDQRPRLPRPDPLGLSTDAYPYSSAEGDYAYAYTDMESNQRSQSVTPDNVLSPGTTLTVRKSYSAKGTGEVTVTAGDKVEIVRPMQGNMIQIKLQGRCGLIPVYCIYQGQATYL